MRLPGALAIGALALTIGASAIAYLSYRDGMAEARRSFEDILSNAPAAAERYDPATVAQQPEIARRYFNHAIAPGTPLATTVELEMKGTFLLGDKNNHQEIAMIARQALRPPLQFVWMPVLRSGAMVIIGSDALAARRAWTRFWLARLIPVANERTSPDLVKSAAFRAASEAVWLPASLLPQRGAKWEQIGADRARVTVPSAAGPIVLEMTLGPHGAVKDLSGQRWSNANLEKQFRFQPFGGTSGGEKTFGGFTIPARLNVGNHFGTDAYFPFFQVEIVAAHYR